MFKKRNISKNSIRILSNETEDEKNFEKLNNKNLKPLVTDINTIKSRNFEFRSEENQNFVKDKNEINNINSIFPYKTDKIFNNQSIINSYDLPLELKESISNEKRDTDKYKYDFESKNSNIKMNLRMDYQHDICKDYKETGYCGFGDTCKFLHDRSEFKSSWKIDKEWKDQQNKKIKLNQNINNLDKNINETENLPLSCFICKEEWSIESNPVITICSHIFCEKCALNHYIKSSRCFQCDLPTNGIFNIAEKIIDLIKNKDSEVAYQDDINEE